MEPVMDHVSRRLSEAHEKNMDGHWYVSRLALDEIFNKITILKILQEEKFADHNDDPIFVVSSKPGLVNKIHSKAKATLAVLFHMGAEYLRYIIGFIHYGDSMGSDIDHHLPLTKNELLLCRFDINRADAFQSAQWHFIAPKIQLDVFTPNEFRQEVVLPIKLSRPELAVPEEGAFGFVTEIQIEPGHQAEPAYAGRVSCISLSTCDLCGCLRSLSDRPETVSSSYEEGSI
jgi:hypothetical protein